MDRAKYYADLNAYLKKRGVTHFTAEELCKNSVTYVRKWVGGKLKKVAIVNELAPPTMWDSAVRLGLLLEEIRAFFKKPVYVMSGYRCPAYNKAVGGKSASLHMKFCAADIHVEGHTPREVFDYMEKEYPKAEGMCGRGLYDTFTHVDVRKGYARWYG